MGAFFNALGRVAKAGWEISDRGMAHKQQKRAEAKAQADEEDRRRRLAQEDVAFADQILGRGGRSVRDGLVEDEQGRLVPADKSRTITRKNAAGEDVSFEIPTPERQSMFAIDQLLQQFKSPQAAELRGLQRTEGAADVKAGEAAKLAPKIEAEQQQRSAIGLQIPPGLAEALGISVDEAGRYLPTELKSLGDTLTDMRPKAGSTPTSHYETDSKGNVTAITPDGQGGFATEDLGPIGKPAATSAAGGLTPYQMYQMGRNEQAAAKDEYKRKRSVAENLQKTLDTLQADQDKIIAQNTELGQETVALGRELASGDMKASDKLKARTKIAANKAKIAANKTLFDAKEREKNTVDQRRRQAWDAVAPGSQGDEERVTVVSPNGETGTIPKSQLKDALAQGYSQAKTNP